MGIQPVIGAAAGAASWLTRGAGAGKADDGAGSGAMNESAGGAYAEAAACEVGGMAEKGGAAKDGGSRHSWSEDGGVVAEG